MLQGTALDLDSTVKGRNGDTQKGGCKGLAGECRTSGQRGQGAGAAGTPKAEQSGVTRLGQQEEVGSERLCGRHARSMKLSWHLPTPPLSARAHDQGYQLREGLSAKSSTQEGAFQGHAASGRLFRAHRQGNQTWDNITHQLSSHHRQVYVQLRDGSNSGCHRSA